MAGNTRKDIEKQLGESIVTSKNARDTIKELTEKRSKLGDKPLKTRIKRYTQVQ